MGDLHEFTVATRIFLKTYRWQRIDPLPWATLGKPLSRCRVGLVSSAGMVLPGQPRFDEDRRGGDSSLREISDSENVRALIQAHRSHSFDRKPLQRDPEIAFPINRLHELVDEGAIGSANRRHLSFMGSITAPSSLIRDSAPEAARLFREDGVDVALLVPV